jgi:hypothetical protein
MNNAATPRTIRAPCGVGEVAIVGEQQLIGMWRRPTGAGKKGCVLLGSKVLTTMAKPGRHAGSLSNRRACFSEWRAWWLPSTVAIRPLDSRQLYRSNFDDLFQLTTAKPFAGSSTCLAAVEAVGCEHLLRSPRGYLRKDRAATGQSHIRRPRQVENVITVQEHPEHLRTPNDANDTVWRPEHSQGFLERSTGRVPEQRLFI